MLRKSFYGNALLAALTLLSMNNVFAGTITPAFLSPDSSLPIRSFRLTSDNTIAKPAIATHRHARDFNTQYLRQNEHMLHAIRERSSNYFAIMDSVFTRFGIPTEVKYLAIVESQLKPRIRSRAGAVGAWQLMPVTARHFSLRVNKYQDERTDFYKSTVAAAKYLKYLYKIFDDWLLVMAAYNGGPGTVFKAIRKSGSRDFWKLQQFLPAETRGHVKKFISTHYFFEEGGSIVTLTKAERLKYEVAMMEWEKESSLCELAE